MNKKIFGVIISFLLLLPIVLAQSLFQNWYQYLNIPKEYTTFPTLLYFVLIPFLGTFAIIWGILTNLRIFTLHKVNILLSFIFTFALLYSGILLVITFYLFQVGGFFGIIAFFVLFFGLTSLYTYRRIGRGYIAARRVYERYQEVTGERRRRTGDVVRLDREIQERRREQTRLNREERGLNALRRAILQRVHAGSEAPNHPEHRRWISARDGVRSLTGRTPRDRREALRFIEDRVREIDRRMRDFEREITEREQRRERAEERAEV